MEYELFYSNYYITPLDALYGYDMGDYSGVQTVIGSYVKNESAVVFYISEDNKHCRVDYSSKRIMSKLGWRITGIDRYSLDNVKEQDDVSSYKFAINLKNSEIDDDKQLLYGIIRLNNVQTIQINGEEPSIKKYRYDGADFIFWYIISSGEVNDISITF